MNRLIALTLASASIFGLAGCAEDRDAAVGTVGEEEAVGFEYEGTGVRGVDERAGIEREPAYGVEERAGVEREPGYVVDEEVGYGAEREPG